MNKNIFIIIVILAFALGIYLIYPKANEAYSMYNTVKSQKAAVADLENQVNELKQKQQREEMQARENAKPIYVNEADTGSSDQMSSFGVMFEDIISAAKYNNMKLRSIEYNTQPSEDIIYQNIKDFYNVCVVKMELIGNYSQFKSYFEDIYNYPYLINIAKIDIKPYEKDPKILLGTVNIALYSKK